MENIKEITKELKTEGYNVADFLNWYSNNPMERCYIAERNGKFYYIYSDGLIEFYPEDLKNRLSERLYRVFGKPERAFQSLWEWACSGDNDRLAEYYENGGKLNLRYEAFGKFHSLVMGALRNRNYETVKYLLFKGETVTESERDEFKKYYTEKLIDAAEKLTDYFSYHNKNLTGKQYELFDELKEIIKKLK